MNTPRVALLARGMRQLRRRADLAALRAARTPTELADRALIPAGRNLAIAIGFLAAPLRAEATAALLASRVLDAYEDLSPRATAADDVRAAVAYLTGATDTVPPTLPELPGDVRDSEAVDRLLAERIADVAALLDALSPEARERVNSVLVDMGAVMAHNIESPLTRVAYSEGVLGRVTHYACSLVATDALAETDLRDLTACVAVIAQSANDLRDGEYEIYGVADRTELTRMVMLRLLSPALGAFALLDRMGPGTPSVGARAAMAYMTITTSAFLCAAVNAPPAYKRPLAAATLAACSAKYWTKMLDRLRATADTAIHTMLDTSPDFAEGADQTMVLSSNHPSRRAQPAIVPLIVDTTFALVETLPEGPLTGELGDADIRTMMIADHLAFGAMERVPSHQPEAMFALAARLKNAALPAPTSQGARQ
ncbi:hypothetical protein [Nocardia camponoti]|uniref:Uncharacterized protein n=1 Tax=Nocardia camponoti TaxID=1616106 RepID=A0A917V7R8_9NOCA|nr:hypothetical protein [Nocardia camponoti]GGK47286.1 hypothetical protein GCM10011591_18230 [Nocardia camponoti]